MTRRCLALVPATAVVLAAVVACGGSSQKSSDAQVKTEGCSVQNANSAEPVDSTELNVVADVIHPKGQDDFKDVYAGVEVLPDSSRVRVYRKPSSAFDDWIRKTFAEKCVEITNAAHSAVELSDLLSKVEGDTGYWAEVGITITGTAAKPDGSGLVVGVEKEVERARKEMPARYGTNIPIFIEENGPT